MVRCGKRKEAGSDHSQTLLQMKDIPRPDDAADALAVAICYLHSARIEALKGERVCDSICSWSRGRNRF